MKITAETNNKGKLGLQEVLVCKGFHVDIINRLMHFVYAKCIRGLDDSLEEQEEIVRTYSDADRRAVLDEKGQQVYRQDGQPVTVGVFEAWEQMLGKKYIYPDLEATLKGFVK